MKKIVFGIIGGTGMMGQMFKNFFEKEGFIVLISSRNTKLSIEKCASQSDVVIVTVPIDKTIDIIKRIGPLVKKDGLLMDLTSIKVNPLDVMLKHSKCSVLGTHPVFGPGVKTFKNQTIVLCPGRGGKWQNFIEELFVKNDVKLKICSAEEHDKMMAVIQGMIHFSNIIISHVLKELNIRIEDSLDFSSPIYKLRLDIVGRILNQDPNLYADIEMMNPYTPDVLETFLNTGHKLFEIIKNKEHKKFVEYFNEASDYAGDFKKEAEKFSNSLIEFLISK